VPDPRSTTLLARAICLVAALLWLCAACTPAVQPALQPSVSPPAPLTTPSAPAGASSVPRSTASLVPSLNVDEVFRQVEHLRGIEAQHVIPSTATSPAAVASLARESLLVDWPLASLQREVRLLQQFGLSEPATDLDGLVAAIGLDGAAVARSPDGGLAISTDVSSADVDLTQIACAYERLLLEQTHPDAASSLQAEGCLSDVDACLARRALFEGDAALLAEQWLRTFGSSPVATRGISSCGASRSTTDAASQGLVPLLTFPLEHGVEFARSLFLKAGWAGVDQAYTSPPISTEQVLHPERYPKDTPRPPDFADPGPALGTDWTLEDSGTLGEWRTRLVLEGYLDAEDAVVAAEGWDGDHYALLTNTNLGLHALALLTRWDTVRDAHEFSGAFRTYGQSRFGPAKRVGTALAWTTSSGIVILDVGNDQTLWIEAPDATLAAALRKASGFPLY
jgi:hypothetical protein